VYACQKALYRAWRVLRSIKTDVFSVCVRVCGYILIRQLCGLGVCVCGLRQCVRAGSEGEGEGEGAGARREVIGIIVFCVVFSVCLKTPISNRDTDHSPMRIPRRVEGVVHLKDTVH